MPSDDGAGAVDQLPASDEAPDETRAAQRALFGLLAAVLVVTLAGGVALLWRGHPPTEPVSPAVGVVPPPPSGPGPPSGVDVAGYVLARSGALASLSGRQRVVVSFRRYLTRADAGARLASFEASAWLAALPGGPPATVTGDLEPWARPQRQQAAADRAQIERMLPSVTDPQFKSFYQSELVRLAALARGDAGGPVVFGAVVQGDPANLELLAQAPDVRLVDPVGNDVAEVSTLHGLRPEETINAGSPPTRPPAG